MDKEEVYVVWCDDYDAREEWADSHEEAAKKFANDMTEYEMQNITVFIAHKRTGWLRKFKMNKTMTIEAEETK